MTGKSSLTERRKIETELQIARVASRLFAERGAEGTTADAIAEAAGISLRTFYRYFRTKEDAVWPLLAHGGARWRELLARTPTGTPLLEALWQAAQQALIMPDAASSETLEITRGLLRAARSDNSLRAVWYRVNGESEQQLVPVLSELAGAHVDPVHIRLIAAGATDAIRIALELWAATDAETDGPNGPGTLAVDLMRRLWAGLGNDVP